MFDNIKNFIGKIILSNQLSAKTSKHLFMPFDNAQDIGIIYNASESNNEQKIQQFANDLRIEGKKVYLLGFVNEKELSFKKVPHISSEFYWKEKLNFFNLPNPEKIGRFIDTPFDLLFNIYHEENISLQGVSVLSKAKYQLGAQMNLATQLFDITIDTGNNKDLYYLAKQMEFYLKAI